MHNLRGVAHIFYMTDRIGKAQEWTLCANVIVPRDIAEAELQRSANEVFRANDELRVRFVEDGENKMVYQEIKPFEEQKFELFHFNSTEELDAWGQEFASIPVSLDVRAMDKEGIPFTYWLELMGIKLSPIELAKGIADAKAEAKRIKNTLKKLGIKTRSDGCCEVKLVKYPGGSGVVVKVHHIAADGWSMALIANQFLQALKGEEVVAYSYEQHLEDDDAYRRSKAFKRDREFFERQLLRCKPEPFPASIAARRKTVTLDDKLSNDIWDYCKSHKLSPYALFLTAMGVYLRCLKGREKSFVGSLCINRAGIRDKNTVGLFVNTPPVLLELDANASFSEAIASASAANLRTMRHQRAYFDVSIPCPYLYIVSYQNALINADPTATSRQYYNDGLTNIMLTAEDRGSTGCFSLHLDANEEACPDDREMEELLEFVTAVLRKGVADDTKPIRELGAWRVQHCADSVNTRSTNGGQHL